MASRPGPEAARRSMTATWPFCAIGADLPPAQPPGAGADHASSAPAHGATPPTRGEARFLKALIGIGPVPQQPVGSPPGCRTIPAQDFSPIRHECLPPPSRISTMKSLGTRFFLQAPPDQPASCASHAIYLVNKENHLPTRRGSEGTQTFPSLARRVDMGKVAELLCRGNRSMLHCDGWARKAVQPARNGPPRLS